MKSAHSNSFIINGIAASFRLFLMYLQSVNGFLSNNHFARNVLLMPEQEIVSAVKRT